MNYQQITSVERYIISALRKQGLNQSEIARHLGKHRSSICREFQRNCCNDGDYRPSKAASRTRNRRSRSRRNRRFSERDFRPVVSLLRQQWSPEQISGYLDLTGRLSISHETIYRYVWHDWSEGGVLYRELRGARKQRRKRYRSYDSRGRLAGKRHISERPEAVTRRNRRGHWEIDTVVGSSLHCVVTLVERRTGFVLIGKLRARTKEELNQRTIALIMKHAKRFKTITADNGTEFHAYNKIEKATGVIFYFATPHHSWERGSNENANGLIRQYLPKRTSMTRLTQHQCNAIAYKLNTRPRKRLGYKTPEECFYAK
jgi:transposase, IS30 family